MKENILIGIDFGTKRIGFAVGQTITKTANPIKIIETKNNNINWKLIRETIIMWNPDKIIGGLPLDFNKRKTSITILAENFFSSLKHYCDIEIQMIEEAFSTRAAKWRNQNTKNNNFDALSACIILETWMNK